MRVLYALICEEAESRPDGRLDAQGIFHQLFAPGFPAQQDQMVVAIAIEWDAGEIGRYDFRIDLLDPSRSPTLTINGHTEVGPQDPQSGPPQTRLVMPLEGVVFPEGGTYMFRLHAAGQEIDVCPIHLVENPDLH